MSTINELKQELRICEADLVNTKMDLLTEQTLNEKYKKEVEFFKCAYEENHKALDKCYDDIKCDRATARKYECDLAEIECELADCSENLADMNVKYGELLDEVDECKDELQQKKEEFADEQENKCVFDETELGNKILKQKEVISCLEEVLKECKSETQVLKDFIKKITRH